MSAEHNIMEGLNTISFTHNHSLDWQKQSSLLSKNNNDLIKKACQLTSIVLLLVCFNFFLKKARRWGSATE